MRFAQFNQEGKMCFVAANCVRAILPGRSGSVIELDSLVSVEVDEDPITVVDSLHRVEVKNSEHGGITLVCATCGFRETRAYWPGADDRLLSSQYHCGRCRSREYLPVKAGGS